MLKGQRFTVTLLLACASLAACHSPRSSVHYLGPERPAEYLRHATEISFPEVSESESRYVHFDSQPRTVRTRDEDEIWDLSLASCIQICLSRSQAIRNHGQFSSPNNSILTNPEAVPSVFDPAIQASGVLFGQRGVEAALSDFDAQFTTSMIWGRNEQVQNNTLSLGLPAGDVLTQETATWNASLQKQLATGGSLSVGHNWNYNASNIGTPPLLFPSVYEGNVQLQFRQPLLAGSGVEYTRIAGPVSDNLQGVSGVSQGVIIARINDDLAIAEFERNVHQMLHDLEMLYWQLHLAYQNYAIRVEARESALQIWRVVDSQAQAQTGPGGVVESNLREDVLVLGDQADLARDALYEAEAHLRLLMGLPVNDGKVIRPSDEPLTAELVPDWGTALAQAYQLRPEIRRQKWNIRSLDLQRKAAENLTLPRLDFVSSYQVNGFGDNLLDGGSSASSGPFGSAYRNLANGNQTGWNLGLQYSVPVGRRYAFSQLRSIELRLMKSQALLVEQETEISHEIAAVFRELDRNYSSMKSAYNRVLISQERQEMTLAQYQNDPTVHSIETISHAQQSLTQAELAYASSLQQYNTAIANLHYRTGRILQENSILLQEGPWKAEAEKDAQRNYEKRKHAVPGRMRHVSPEPFSRISE